MGALPDKTAPAGVGTENVRPPTPTSNFPGTGLPGKQVDIEQIIKQAGALGGRRIYCLGLEGEAIWFLA